MSQLAKAFSKPEDQCRLLLSILLQVPMGLVINRFLHAKTTRLVFCLCAGLFLQLYMYRAQAYHIYAMAAGAYILMTHMPRATQHYYTIGFIMAYLSA